MNWTSVKDDFPNDRQEVIVFDGSSKFLANFIERKDKRLKKRAGYFEAQGDDLCVDEITHWIPAPDDPKEE